MVNVDLTIPRVPGPHELDLQAATEIAERLVEEFVADGVWYPIDAPAGEIA